MTTISPLPEDTGQRARLGILGGMGPLATADFFTKLIRHTSAERDQDHIPVIIVSDPRIPDRSNAILTGHDTEVLLALISGLQILDTAGVDGIVIPCNTAHYWIDELQRQTSCTILSIVDAAIAYAKHKFPLAKSACVLGTAATLKASVYDEKLFNANFDLHLPNDAIRALTSEVIMHVKAGRYLDAETLFGDLISGIANSVDIVFLACTELPIAGQKLLQSHSPLVDTSDALAWYSVKWINSQ